jgi:hypothetical protein
MSTSHSHPSSQLAAAWSSRLHSLKTALDEDPNNFQAWHWRIQVRVLTFLVSRYGDDPNCDWEREKHAAPPLVFDVEFSAQEKSKLLISRSTMRRYLRRIEEANPGQTASANNIRNSTGLHSNNLYFTAPCTYADLEDMSRGKPFLRWLPLIFLVLRSIFYLVIVLLLLAPWLLLLSYLANP